MPHCSLGDELQVCYSSTGVFETTVARSPFRREALVLRRLRRPAIDPVLRSNATAMALSDRPSAFNSRSSSSSDGFHGLLLFFGMVRGNPVRAAKQSIRR
jgi:hypothetical protein